MSHDSGAYMNNRLDRQPLPLPPPGYSINIEQASTKPIEAEFKKLKRGVVALVNKLPTQEVWIINHSNFGIREFIRIVCI